MLFDAKSVIEKIYKREDELKIGICIPSFGEVSLPWASRMWHLAQPMNTTHMECYVIGQPVDKARNELVATCLNEGCTHIFFVDDDVLIPFDALVKLFAHNKPIVSGVYFVKDETPQPLIIKGVCGGIYTDWKQGDVIECDSHGMGCTLIRKEVFDAVMPHVEKDERGIPQWFKTRKEEDVADGVGGIHKLSMTEDTDFCCKAKTLGYQPTVDTGVFCYHWDKNKKIAFPKKEWETEMKKYAEEFARLAA